jgi:uncharacterized protein DUF3667
MDSLTYNYIICPNCENEFSASNNYCPYCGQVNKPQRLGFKFIITDLLSANFNLDSKIVITLKLLILSPAGLTREFFLGRRTKYLSPIRLYLLISFIYFFVLSLDPEDSNNLVKTNDNIITSDSVENISGLINYSENDTLDNDSKGTSYLKNNLMGKVKRLNSEAGKLMFKQLFQKYTSVGMFILIPLTAFLFFILFFSGTYYFQHLVFSFHLQSLIFLLFTLFNILEWFSDSDILLYIEWLMFLFIVFIWIRGYYQKDFLKTIWKLILFLSGYFFILIFYFGIVILLSVYNLEGLK